MPPTCAHPLTPLQACLVLAVLHDLGGAGSPAPPAAAAHCRPSLARTTALATRLRALDAASRLQRPPPVAALAHALGQELARLRARLFAPPLPSSLLQLERLAADAARRVDLLERLAEAVRGAGDGAEGVARALDGAVAAAEAEALSGPERNEGAAARVLRAALGAWLDALEAWLTRGDTCAWLPFAPHAPPPPAAALPLCARDPPLVHLFLACGNAAALAPLPASPRALAPALSELLFLTARAARPPPPPPSLFAPPPPLVAPSEPRVRTHQAALSALLPRWLLEHAQRIAAPRTQAALHAVRGAHALEAHLAALRLGALLSAPSLHAHLACRALGRPPPLAFAEAALEACGAQGALLTEAADGGVRCELPPALATLLMPPDTHALYAAVSRLLARLLAARTRLVEGRFALGRREQLHWLTALEAYARQSVLEPGWAVMLHAVRQADSTEQVSAAHAAFAAHMRERLFFAPRHAPLRARLEALLALCEEPLAASAAAAATSASSWRAEMRLLIGLLARAAALRHAPHCAPFHPPPPLLTRRSLSARTHRSIRPHRLLPAVTPLHAGVRPLI